MSGRTGRRVASTGKSQPGRTGPFPSRASRPRRLQRLRQLSPQIFEPGVVRRTPRTHEHVDVGGHRIQLRQQLPPCDLAKPSLHQIAVHHPLAVLRHDGPEPRTRSGGSRVEDVEVLRPPALPPPQQRFDLRAACDPRVPGETLTPGSRLGVYFPPTFTVSLARPRRRRRLSVLRPPFVFIRARNPCLLTRLRLRGLYVGFI